MTSTPTSGNVLIAVIGTTSSVNYATVVSISETGVTWSKQIGYSYWYYDDAEIWLGVVGSGASTSITITLSRCEPENGFS